MENAAQKSIVVSLEDMTKAANCQRESYSLQQDVNLAGNGIKVISPLTIRITLMRIKEGIHVSIESLNCIVEFKCARCLQAAKREIELTDLERIFYFKASSADSSDPFDIFLVDMKNAEIDIYEMIRTEILLHFPETTVCSTHCKGLCSHCGKELNKNKCSCKKEENQEIELGTCKPLSILKDLFEKNN